MSEHPNTTTAWEWKNIKRCSPARAYADLLFMARRKEAVMHPEIRGLWRDKWSRRCRTRFEIKPSTGEEQ